MTSSDRERQSAEVVLLESMYPSEFSWRSDRELSLGDDESSAEPSFTLQLHRTSPRNPAQTSAPFEHTH